MINVFLLLGSNLGDKRAFLQAAIGHIETDIALVEKTSSIYETQSWGKTNEPDYLNQVVWLKTNLPARDVLEKILNIENVMGRIREEKWGARIIDIDILFYGEQIINEPGLHVPHPQIQNRMFTLAPLNEIAPDLTHPVLKKRILELKNELKDDLIVKKL